MTAKEWSDAGETARTGSPKIHVESGKESTFERDRVGKEVRVVDSSGDYLLDYGDAGQLLSVTATNGVLTGIGVTNVYDSILRRTQLICSTAFNHSYGYDTTSSRLTNVSDGTYSAAYSYVDNSSLVGQVSYHEGSSLRLARANTFDFMNRPTDISNTPSGTGEPAVSSGYTYNRAGQRSRVKDAMDSYWIYRYDSLGQVISGAKHWGSGVMSQHSTRIS